MKINQNRVSSFVICAVLLCLVSAGALAQPIVFNNNGVWCWFQDERAIVHNNNLMIGSVSNTGSIEVVQYDIVAGGPPVLAVLHANLQVDDHAAPAFLALPDERILAVYAKHGNDASMRYRISTHPNDAASWGAEQIYTAGAGVTYSNVYRLSAENGGSGRIYNFYRGENYNPNFVTSDNNGQTWTYGLPGVTTDGRLIAIGTGGTTRPYVKYTSNNVDKIHFITTEAHPRNYDNSIYYGYLYQGSLYKADGTWLHDTASGGIAPQSLEKIYQGGANHVAWTTDIDLDADGHPYFVFSVQMNQDMNDLRYWYARWDGAQWTANEIAHAGSALYSAESDYTGLAALDPSHPDILYISADVHPVTGNPLISAADGKRHYEIFRGTTTDKGVTWRWEFITRNSTQDNIRPIIPQWDGGTILLWMRGRYTTYVDYNMQIVGLFDPQPDPSPNIIYQPESAGVPLTKTAKFDVYAVSALPMSYTWYKVNTAGSDIQVGGNSRTLTISDVDAGDVGEYYCIVTNTAGTTVSSTAGLVIADLTAYWPMENNYNDVTGHGYNGTAAGSPGFTTGVFSGQAVSFNGSSYLNCRNGTDLTLSDGGTITAWIKAAAASQTSDWASVVTKGRWAWRLCRNGWGSGAKDGISFHFNSPNNEYQANGTITAMDNTWHHLAATYDGRSIKLYVDGQLDVLTATTEAVNSNTDPVYIGSRSDNPAGRGWTGQIDEVRIYNYAMDPAAIQLLYNQNLSCYQANPYDLNDDCQINLDDVSEFAAFAWLDSGSQQTHGCEANPQLDITGPSDEPDCKVDLYEFAETASVWMQCYLLPTSDCL